MNFKLASVPRPKTLALRAEHLVASLGLVNENLAIRARLGVLLQQSDRRNIVGIANMCVIITRGLEFPAMGTGVLVASGTLPSGRHEAIAIGISTAMNELLHGFHMVSALRNQATFGSIQIILEVLKLLDLSIDVLDLRVDVGNKTVMRNGRLCSRKHGLFLSEENVLLVLGEIASEERLGKSEMLNLRMCKGSITKDALCDRDAVATEEGLITRATGSLVASVKRAGNGFAIGRIERIKTDGAGHVCTRERIWRITEERKGGKRNGINFLELIYSKHLTSDENVMAILCSVAGLMRCWSRD
jgi:hypothetical protein